jgi:hypothetical protein
MTTKRTFQIVRSIAYVLLSFHLPASRQSRHGFSLFLTLSLSMCTFHCLAQNGAAINTTGATSAPSAILDVSSTSQGVLIPRISLLDTTDLSTISHPANKLIVYNTNASMTGGNGAGIYIYDSTSATIGKWIYLAAPSNGPGTIGQVLISNGTSASPVWTNHITNLAAPIGDADAATKAYVDAAGAPCITCMSQLSPDQCTSGCSWVQCRDACISLSPGSTPAWRIPTLVEVLYYCAGAFGNQSWINAFVWTGSEGPQTNVYNAAYGYDYPGISIFNESTGSVSSTWGESGTAHCRCVK